MDKHRTTYAFFFASRLVVEGFSLSKQGTEADDLSDRRSLNGLRVKHLCQKELDRVGDVTDGARVGYLSLAFKHLEELFLFAGEIGLV